MELGEAIVMGLRVLWSVAVGGALVGLLPLGALSEFVRDLSRRGKLKLATSADQPPVGSIPSWAGSLLLSGIFWSLLSTEVRVGADWKYPVP